VDFPSGCDLSERDGCNFVGKTQRSLYQFDLEMQSMKLAE